MNETSVGNAPLWLAGQILLVLLPLVLLAATVRIYPNRNLVFLALLPALLSIGLLSSPTMLWVIGAMDVAIVVAAAIDVLRLPRRRWLTVERSAGHVASLKNRHPVEITISNHSRAAHRMTVRDDVPQEFQAEPHEVELRLTGRSRALFEYGAVAGRRGAFAMRRVYVNARSPWGLWQKYLEYPCETEINVYPDLKQLSQYSLLARTNRLNQMGVRRSRRIGQDNEFERLRDYTPDDNYKFIDWRSTARRGRLTVKDFQANQSQRLIFLIDSGRMMTNEAAGVSLLDHAFNSMLMLSYVALSHGDSVGLVTFSDEIHDYVPPRGGRNQMNRLLHASFDRFPSLVESRYDKAFLYLASHCHRRALVVLITNVIDEVNRVQIEEYLQSLVGKHLPLAALLRDRRIFDFVAVPPTDDMTLFTAAAAADVLQWRHQMLVDLQTKGVLALDVFPEDLTAPLVNQYLQIKARHLL